MFHRNLLICFSLSFKILQDRNEKATISIEKQTSSFVPLLLYATNRLASVILKLQLKLQLKTRRLYYDTTSRQRSRKCSSGH